MKLNRTGSNWNELERNKINENWDIIEGGYNDVVGQITDEVVGHLIDSARLDWKEPVDTVEDLPANAEVGETRMVREADPDGVSYVYRYDGENWEKIQAIDVTLVNEVDRRLTAQLADITDTFMFKANMATNLLAEGKKGKRTIVSFISDDGAMADYTILKDLFAEKGVKYGMGIVTNYVGTSGYMSWEQIREMVNAGHEVLSHSHMHRDSVQLTADELDEDTRTALTLLNRNGHYPDGFIYPFNSHSPTTVSVIQKYFKYAFTKTQSNQANIGRNFPIIDNQRIARISIGSFFDNVVEGFPEDTTSLEYYKARIDEAVANKNWIVFVLHPWHADFTATQQQHLRDVIDYIKSLGIDIVLPSEGFAIYGNTVQLGIGGNKFWIDADNNVDSSADKLVITPVNAKKSTADIVSDFEIRKITMTPITNAFAASEGYPESRGGILTTYSLESDIAYRYQSYEITTLGSHRRVYTRFLNYGSTEWGEWSLSTHGTVVIETLNNRTNADTPTKFPYGKITYTPFNNSHAGTEYAKGLPWNRGGTLITSRISSDYFVAKQEYIVSAALNSGKEIKFQRYATSSDVWGAWERLGGQLELFFDKTVPIGSIPANSTKDIVINDLTGLSFQDSVTAVPFGATTLPVGVIHSVYLTNTNSLTLRLANVTGNPVTVSDTRWSITVRPR